MQYRPPNANQGVCDSLGQPLPRVNEWLVATKMTGNIGTKQVPNPFVI